MLRTRKARQRAVLSLVTALAIVVGAGLYMGGYLRDNLQAVFYDAFITQAPAKAKNQITVIGIDDTTIKEYGRFPLPRQAYADLLKALGDLKASDGVRTPPTVIALDVSFYDPSGDTTADANFAAAVKASTVKNDQGNVVGGQVILAAQGLGSSTISGGVQKFSTLQLPLQSLLGAGAIPGIVSINPSPHARVRETTRLRGTGRALLQPAAPGRGPRAAGRSVQDPHRVRPRDRSGPHRRSRHPGRRDGGDAHLLRIAARDGPVGAQGVPGDLRVLRRLDDRRHQGERPSNGPRRTRDPDRRALRLRHPRQLPDAEQRRQQDVRRRDMGEHDAVDLHGPLSGHR